MKKLLCLALLMPGLVFSGEYKEYSSPESLQVIKQIMYGCKDNEEFVVSLPSNDGEIKFVFDCKIREIYKGDKAINRNSGTSYRVTM